eukprot:COSAG01_NODE_2018_length_8636_cov_3.178400_2_plen_70_part_00
MPKAAAATEEPASGGGEGRCGPVGPRKVAQNCLCIKTAPLGTVVTTLVQLTGSQQQLAGHWLIVNLPAS